MSKKKLICGNCRYIEAKQNTSSCNCRFNPPMLMRRFVQLDEYKNVTNLETASVSPSVYVERTACNKFVEVTND